MTDEECLARIDRNLEGLRKMRSLIRNIPGHAALKPEIDLKIELFTNMRRAIEPVQDAK